MSPEELRAAIVLIEDRVVLSSERPAAVAFEAPAVEDLMRLGLAMDEAQRLRGASWWDEMAEEIVDTPSFCGADESAETVLRYARDVVGEYVRKRFTPAP